MNSFNKLLYVTFENINKKNTTTIKDRAIKAQQHKKVKPHRKIARRTR